MRLFVAREALQAAEDNVGASKNTPIRVQLNGKQYEVSAIRYNGRDDRALIDAIGDNQIVEVLKGAQRDINLHLRDETRDGMTLPQWNANAELLLRRLSGTFGVTLEGV
jgi:hypothetical protein